MHFSHNPASLFPLKIFSEHDQKLMECTWYAYLHKFFSALSLVVLHAKPLQYFLVKIVFDGWFIYIFVYAWNYWHCNNVLSVYIILLGIAGYVNLRYFVFMLIDCLQLVKRIVFVGLFLFACRCSLHDCIHKVSTILV